ncbi:hypothetical protein OAH18_03100 [bacterium]|nr:hypothetical protein [bacterium]
MDEPVEECAWCNVKLTTGEIFNYELKYEGWKQGGLLAPENPDFEYGQEPLPSCGRCHESITENFDAFREERELEDQRRNQPVGRFQRSVLVTICVAPLVIFPLVVVFTLLGALWDLVWSLFK